MSVLEIAALLVTLTALFSWINHRWIKLPTTIGVMVISLVVSLLLVGLGHAGTGIETWAEKILEQLDFDTVLMEGMLSFLLFAGALHVNLEDLAKQKWVIAILASVGVVVSTFLIGGAAYLLFGLLGLELPFIYCLLFGSLISPTDPIAVLGILKVAGVPKSLETKVTGESLFNDGIGVVVFLVILEVATGHHEFSFGHVGKLFVMEAIGGALLGLLLGWVTYQLLKSVDNYQVEVLLTLALVMGGYALVAALHMSGPIAIVIAGLFIGNHGRTFAMSDKTREHLDTFWELVDEILNALLFVLIGLEFLIVTFEGSYILAGLLAIPMVLLARTICVATPVHFLRKKRPFTPGAVRVMVWGGLRGGISVALALSIPKGDERDLILAVTYVVVVFSILVQGLTVGKLVDSIKSREAKA